MTQMTRRSRRRLGCAEMYFYWTADCRKPRRLQAPNGGELLQAASGERHSLLLLSNHRVYSCGDNSLGQLGQKRKQNTERPGEYAVQEWVPEPDGMWTPRSLDQGYLEASLPALSCSSQWFLFPRTLELVCVVCFGFQFLFFF